MNSKLGLCLVVAVAMAACFAEAGITELRNKYRRFGSSEGGFGGGSGAAAASAGPGGVSSSVAASAAAAGYGYQSGRNPGQYLAQQQPPSAQYYQPQQYGRAPAVYRPAPQQQHLYQMPRQPAYYEGGLIEQQPQFAYGNQAAPVYGGQQYGQQFVAPQRYAPEPRFVKSNRGPVYQPGAATSSAAAAAASSGGRGHGGSAAAAAATSVSGGSGAASAGQYYAPEHDRHTIDQEEMSQHYEEPETVNHYAASAGTYGDGNGGTFEEGSYARDTESVENHEDGREDGDHYYNAQAYGKANDVHNHMAYNNKEEDVEHTPNMFRKKKSKTNFVSNFDKQHRETGSGVVAHDKHSASYNKNSKKLKENVDQRFTKGADGMIQTKNFNSNSDVDDEDEEAMDTRGLGNFVGVDGVLHAKRAQPNNPAAAAAAAAASSFQAGR